MTRASAAKTTTDTQTTKVLETNQRVAAQPVRKTKIKISRSRLLSKKAQINLSEMTKKSTSRAECPPSAVISVDTWTNINQTSNLTKSKHQTKIFADKTINSQKKINCLLSAVTSEDTWTTNQRCNPRKRAPTTIKQTSKPLTNAKTGSKRIIATKVTSQTKVGIKEKQAHLEGKQIVKNTIENLL